MHFFNVLKFPGVGAAVRCPDIGRSVPIRYWLILILWLCQGLDLAAQEIKAQATLDSNYAETGNPFVIHIYSPRAVGQPLEIDFSAWDSIIDRQNILSQSEVTRTQNLDAFYISIRMIHFDEDTLNLPPLTLRLNGGQVATTNPLQVIVLATPSPDDPKDMAPIKDIRAEPKTWRDYLSWWIAVALIPLLVLALFWWYERRNKKFGPRSRQFSMPPYELAQRKLKSLAEKQLWQQGHIKAYYAELTYIFREYIERQHRLPALESTTEDLLRRLKTGGLFEPRLGAIAQLLTHADLAKFAKGMPPEAFHEESFEIVQRVIMEDQGKT